MRCPGNMNNGIIFYDTIIRGKVSESSWGKLRLFDLKIVNFLVSHRNLIWTSAKFQMRKIAYCRQEWLIILLTIVVPVSI